MWVNIISLSRSARVTHPLLQTGVDTQSRLRLPQTPHTTLRHEFLTPKLMFPFNLHEAIFIPTSRPGFIELRLTRWLSPSTRSRQNCIISLLCLLTRESESESGSVVSDSLRPGGLYSPWNSSGHNTGVGSLSLLQGFFPTQGSNPCLQIRH